MRYLPRKRITLTPEQIRSKLARLKDQSRALDDAQRDYRDRWQNRYSARRMAGDVATEIARLQYQLWLLTGEEVAA